MITCFEKDFVCFIYMNSNNSEAKSDYMYSYYLSNIQNSAHLRERYISAATPHMFECLLLTLIEGLAFSGAYQLGHVGDGNFHTLFTFHPHEKEQVKQCAHQIGLWVDHDFLKYV